MDAHKKNPCSSCSMSWLLFWKRGSNLMVTLINCLLSLKIYNKCLVIGNFRQTIKCVIKVGVVVSTEVVKFITLEVMVQVLGGGWLFVIYKYNRYAMNI